MSDGTVIESLIVEWRLEYDSFKRKSEEVKKEIEATKKDVESTDKSFSDLGSTTKDVAQGGLEDVKRQAEEVKRKMKETKEEINGTSSSFTGMNNAAKEASRGGLMSLITQAGKVFIALKTLKTVVNETWDAIKVAMDVYESEELFEISLRNMADSARTWSENLAESIKAPATEIRESLGLWTTMTRSMGLTNESAVSMSQNLVQLKYDIMSFYNLDSERVNTIIKGMIAGQTEPAKQIGVILTEEMAKRSLVTAGIIQEGEAVDATTLMYGRYLALMEQTSTAHGNMVAELDSPANQLRQLETQLYQIKLAWGQAFLPIVQVVLPLLTSLAQSIATVATGFRNFMQTLFGAGKATMGKEIGPQKIAAPVFETTKVSLDGVTGSTVDGGSAWSDYGKKASNALDKTRKGVAALKRDLMGFDDLNRVSDPNSAMSNALGSGNPLSPGSIKVPSIGGLNPDDYSIPSLDDIDFALPDDASVKSKIISFGEKIGKWYADIVPWGKAFTFEWVPDGLSEATAARVEPFLAQWHSVQAKIKEWAWGNKTVTKEMAEEMAAAISEMGELIKSEIDRDTQELYEKTKEYFENSNALTEEREAEILAEILKGGENRKEAVDNYTARINEIYQNASEENRAVTEEEQEEITRLYRLIRDEGIAAMSESEREQTRILQHLQINAEQISTQQAADIVKNSKEARDEAIAAALDQYNGVVKAAKQMYEAGAITEEEYNAIVKDAEEARDLQVGAANDTHDEVLRLAQEQAGRHAWLVDWETGEVRTKWDALKTALGMTWDETKQAFTNFKNSFGEKWDGVKDWFNTYVAPWFTAERWKQQMQTAVSQLANIRIPKFKIDVSYNSEGFAAKAFKALGLAGTPNIKFDFYEQGGFPNYGDLFIANEKGPEMIGRMGNRNVVANNQQITAGIAESVGPAVFNAVVQAMGSSRQGGDMIFPIHIGGKKVYEFMVSESQRANLKAGQTIIPVGGY